MSAKQAQDPIQRKLLYLLTLGSEDGIALSMETWLAKLKEIQKEISYDVIWRILMDLYLNLQIGIDWSQFEFPPITDIVIPPIIIPPLPPFPPDPPPLDPNYTQFYGSVYDKVTKAPLDGGTLKFIGPEQKTVSFFMGSYLSGTLQEGSYAITAELVGYNSLMLVGVGTKNNVVEVDFGLDRVDIPLDKGQIFGTVYNRQTGELIMGGTISGTGLTPFTVLVVNGQYSSGDLEPNTYSVSITLDGYYPVTQTATIVAGIPYHLDFPLTKIGFDDTLSKMIYDDTWYDLCYYDPPELALVDIERFAWNQRYHVSEKNTLEYKKMSLALKTLLEANKDALKNANVNPDVVNMTEDIATMVESRILRGFYVGFAIVGLSRVADKHLPQYLFRTKVPTRMIIDWKTIVNSESVVAHEAIVGFARVGYFRVGDWSMALHNAVSKEAVAKINAFWQRSGMVEAGQLSTYGGLGYQAFGYEGVYGAYAGYLSQKYQVLNQRVFMLQRVDQYHYAGGHHQILMQSYIKMVKRICNKMGVIGVLRATYTSYAHEIYYQMYEGHRLWKQWKRVVSVEDITNKYVQMGCDIAVLNKIKDAVRP